MQPPDGRPLPPTEFALATALTDWLKFLNDDGSSLEEALVVTETYNCIDRRGFQPRQCDLCALTRLPRSSVYRHVGNLVEAGRFKLVPDDSDGRVFRIHLRSAEAEHARRWGEWINARQTQLVQELLAGAVDRGEVEAGAAEVMIAKRRERLGQPNEP